MMLSISTPEAGGGQSFSVGAEVKVGHSPQVTFKGVDMLAVTQIPKNHLQVAATSEQASIGTESDRIHTTLNAVEFVQLPT